MNAARPRRSVEWVCVRECLRFSLRHRRYLLIFLVLYWHSLRNWRGARAARYGYSFLQLYDDIMDGDRASVIAPDVIAAQTIADWKRGEFRDDSTLARLGDAFGDALRSLPLLPGDDPRRDVLALLQAMRLDAQRVATHRILTQAEIKDQLRATFHHALNVLLIGSRMRTRASQVPDLVEALGWCSVVRDLDEDLRKGLVNVPSDVVTQMDASNSPLTAGHPIVQRWLDDEKLAARSHVARSALALQVVTAEEPGAGRLLALFQRSIERYAE